MGTTFGLQRQIVVVFGITIWLQLSFWLGTFAPDLVAEDLPLRLADKDFANYWIGARLAVSGEVNDIFGPWKSYFAHMRAAFGNDYPWHAWSYPPHMLLVIAPLSWLSYKAAMCAFVLTTFAFFAFSARALAGKMPLWAWMMVAPAAVLNLAYAQNGFLTSSLILGALSFREKRPVLGGIMLGLLTVKPHLGLLFPILLIIERRTTMILSAAATTLTLIAISAWLFGVDSWRGYFEHVVPYQKHVMLNGTGVFLAMMPSLFAWLRKIGFDSADALTVHALVMLPVLALTIWAMIRASDPIMRNALLVVGTIVVSPYAFSYDLPALAVVIAAMTVQKFSSRARLAPGYLHVMISATLAPAAMKVLGMLTVPMAPVVFASLLLFLGYSALKETAPESPKSLAESPG